MACQLAAFGFSGLPVKTLSYAAGFGQSAEVQNVWEVLSRDPCVHDQLGRGVTCLSGVGYSQLW